MTTKIEMMEQFAAMNAAMIRFQELEQYRMLLQKMEASYEQIIKDRDNFKSSYEFQQKRTKQYEAKAVVFDFMMSEISKEESLRSQWTDLLMTMKLVNSDVEAQIQEVINKAAYGL